MFTFETELKTPVSSKHILWKLPNLIWFYIFLLISQLNSNTQFYESFSLFKSAYVKNIWQLLKNILRALNNAVNISNWPLEHSVLLGKLSLKCVYFLFILLLFNFTTKNSICNIAQNNNAQKHPMFGRSLITADRKSLRFRYAKF